jgi:F-type H+-transporting ATPase subunit epsilon
MPLTVHIITPEKALPVLQASHVTIPGTEGEAGIRIGHAPYVTLLRNGRVFIRSAHLPDSVYAVRGGVAQVYHDEVRILTEAIADPGMITESDLLARLRKILDSTYDDPIEQIGARAEAGWIVTQLTVAGKDVPDVSKLDR